MIIILRSCLCRDTIPESDALIKLSRVSSYIPAFQKRKKKLIYVFEEEPDDESPTISDVFRKGVSAHDATDFFCNLRDRVKYLTRD